MYVHKLNAYTVIGFFTVLDEALTSITSNNVKPFEK